jgi:peptidoglycan/xylan/chitin deacetylase (PgdA/CDA1 family)
MESLGEIPLELWLIVKDVNYLQDLKDDFDVLYAEAASRRRMMSISTHDRISGIPGRVKLIEEFIKYARKQKGGRLHAQGRDRQVGLISA